MFNSANITSYLAWSSKRGSHLITTHPSTVISIIKQIQASITCEAKWLRWVWRECKIKANYTIYVPKHLLPLKPRQIISSPSNQAIWVANIKFGTQEGSNQNTRSLNAKDYTPSEAKVNHKLIWPRHKSHKRKSNHQWSQAKPARHPQQEKCGPPQQLISKQG
jgi:hypothetical protein